MNTAITIIATVPMSNIFSIGMDDVGILSFDQPKANG